MLRHGSSTDKVEIEYPVGHRRRREEGIPLLEAKFKKNLETRFPSWKCEKIFGICLDQDKLESTPVKDFMDLFRIN